MIGHEHIGGGDHRHDGDDGDDEGGVPPDPDAVVSLPLDGVLDLHTFLPRELGSLLPEWLDASREAGVLELRVIHGKGTGVLRERVHAILRRRTDVASFGLAPPERGGWGATLVTLRRP